MSGLFNVKKPAKKFNEIEFNQKEWFTDKEYPIASEIQRLRLQMLVHSYLYYRKGTNIISDKEFDERAHRLADLQSRYFTISCKVKCFKEEFADWEGSTGMHLPLNNPWVMHKAEDLVDRWGLSETRRSDKKIQLPAGKGYSKKVGSKSPAKQWGTRLF